MNHQRYFIQTAIHGFSRSPESSGRLGDDGQGTHIVRDFATLANWLNLSNYPEESIEQFVPFVKELAIIATRSLHGEVVTYPIVETEQEQQVCRRAMPSAITPAQSGEIRRSPTKSPQLTSCRSIWN